MTGAKSITWVAIVNITALLEHIMTSGRIGNGEAGGSSSVNDFKSLSSSVDWLSREMLEMRLQGKVDHEDRVSFFLFMPVIFGHFFSFFLCEPKYTVFFSLVSVIA